MHDPGPAEAKHTSHLDAVRWPVLTGADGSAVPGFVRRGHTVKAINDVATLAAYSRVPDGAPVVYGNSWTNLHLCGGWRADWRRPGGTKVLDHLVIADRVAVGTKLCGQMVTTQGKDWNADEAAIRRTVRPGFSLVSSAHHFGPDWTMWWLAPKALLGDLVDVEAVAAFYAAVGDEESAGYVMDAAGLYLPEFGEDPQWDRHNPFCVIGLVLGYPPESTASRIR